MIDDPIDFRGKEWTPLDYTGQKLFFIVDAMLGFAFCAGNLNCSVEPIFNIHSGFNNYRFSVAGCDMTKSQFLEIMRTEYPDHFEWLLWHQEWLK